jgi:uncharacterized protein (TIGR02284 family)
MNDLVETCKDGEEGFRQAAEGTQRSDLRTLFQEYSRQRAQFASELQMEVARLGGSPEKSGSMGGALHRGWMNIKSAVTGKDDYAILAEAERGEDAAVKSYREVLSKDLPSDIRSMVQRQFEEIQSAHRKIRELRDAAASKASEMETVRR